MSRTNETGAFAHSDEIFRTVVEATPSAIVVADEQGHIVLLNTGAEKLFGYARQELIGQPVELLVPERFRAFHPSYRTAYARHAEARPMGKGRDLFALRKNGTEVPVEIGLNPIETPQGSFVLSVVIDISERKAAQDRQSATLRELNDVRAALDEHAIVAMTDAQGTIVYVNDKFCDISQYSRAELLGQDHRIINSGHHPKEFMRNLWQTIARGHVWKGEIKNRAKDGSYYWVDTTIVPFLREDGKPHHYIAIRADITERKRAEEQLKASLKDVRDLSAALDEHAIVAITDPQGKITYVNDKFCAISKYSREELLGQDHRIINSAYHPKEFIRNLWTTIGRGEVWHGEIKNRAKDGSYYWVDTTIVPFLREDGKPHHYIAIRADITERKKIEEDVRRLNVELEHRVAQRTAELEVANKELEAFSYSVSHDLRAPLRAIDGFSQAVLDDFGPQLPEEGRHYLQTIRGGAQRMGALIDDLLTFSRLSRLPLNRHPITTSSLVRQALADLAKEQEGREIEVDIGELPSCEGDAALLKQVWVNLLSNAIKYTRQRKDVAINVGAKTENGETVYYVSDNGVGFDMQYAHKLFGVFQRLHRAEDFEGTGVGLAIVDRIIHRHQGRVWAEAEAGKGATFYFTLGNGDQP